MALDSLQKSRLRQRLGNPRWRLENLYWILDEDGHEVRFSLRPAIVVLLANLWWRNIVLKARQLGFTTFIDVFFLDSCMWTPNLKAVIVAHKMPAAKAIFERVILHPYKKLPAAIRELVPADYTKTEIQFANGSGVEVSTSARSGTAQLVHISELGYTSAHSPSKAREIVTGTLEAAHKRAMVFVESTAEGQSGQFYDLWQSAVVGTPVNPLSYRRHFFAWFDNPSYTLDPRLQEVTAMEGRYFDKLQVDDGISLTPGQKAWYVSKSRILRENMHREHPSTPEEAFEASVMGAYWAAQIHEIEQRGQVTDVPWDPVAPVYAWWDLGDMHTAGGMAQFMGEWIRVVDSYEDNSGQGIGVWASAMKSLPYHIAEHWAGGDIWGSNAKSMQTGRMTVDVAREHGIDFQRVMDHRIEARISGTRMLFSRMLIDKTRCAVPIRAWRQYRKGLDDAQSTAERPVYKSEPHKDWTNHFSDALGYMCMTYRYQAIGGRYIGDIGAAAAYLSSRDSGAASSTRTELYDVG